MGHNVSESVNLSVIYMSIFTRFESHHNSAVAQEIFKHLDKNRDRDMDANDDSSLAKYNDKEIGRMCLHECSL